jgi:hypothetical protein
MIFRLLALILLPIMAYYSAKSISQKFQFNARQNQILFLIMSALLIVAVLIALGRLPVHFIFAPLGAFGAFLLRFLPTLMRLLPFWQMLMSTRATAKPRSENQASTIRTEYLEMVLGHDTGDMDGRVLRGSNRGTQLSELPLGNLLDVLRECQDDMDSLQVLEAYLDRQHEGWRQQHSEQASASVGETESVMTRDLALEILGLPVDASNEDIVKAHRSMMQRLHPDRGGSDYLAKKINAAKDFLVD